MVWPARMRVDQSPAARKLHPCNSQRPRDPRHSLSSQRPEKNGMFPRFPIRTLSKNQRQIWKPARIPKSPHRRGAPGTPSRIAGFGHMPGDCRYVPDQGSQVRYGGRAIQRANPLRPAMGKQRGLLLQTAAGAFGTFRPSPALHERLKTVLALLAHVIKHRHTNLTSLKVG
jgi:hypothetical protein